MASTCLRLKKGKFEFILQGEGKEFRKKVKYFSPSIQFIKNRDLVGIIYNDKGDCVICEIDDKIVLVRLSNIEKEGIKVGDS